jgi:hypothetical protein
MNTTSRIPTIAQPPTAALSKRRVAFAGAFLELEPEIRDLTRAARLAQLQLHEAVGELRCDAHGNYIELPDKETVELATFAVD